MHFVLGPSFYDKCIKSKKQPSPPLTPPAFTYVYGFFNLKIKTRAYTFIRPLQYVHTKELNSIAPNILTL